MTDKERVLALVEEGKITQEEADRLLAALGEVEELEDNLEGVEREIAATTEVPKDSAVSRDAKRNSDETDTSTSEPREEAGVPKDLHWVRVNLMAGDIDIKVDDSLSEPIIDGKGSVVKEGDDFVIKLGTKKTGDSLGDMISGFVGKFGDLDIRIPPGYGVDINSKAGDIDIKDVPFLKGKMLAGDIDAKNIGGANVSLSAGDIDISLRPVSGEHRIVATAGDVDITLLEGSSVHLEGAVSMGDFRAKGFEVKESKSLTGGGFSGCVGEGAATLNIQLSAGDLEVSTRE